MDFDDEHYVSALRERVILRALALEEAERQKDDNKMAESLGRLMAATRSLRKVLER